MNHRILTSLQSTGRKGASTLHQGLISWFSYAGIPFSAIDADDEHRTLSSWYPKQVARVGYRDDDDLLGMLNVPVQAPVHLIDFPSQQTQSLLRGFEHFCAFKIFASQDTRPTIFIFASDERASINSAHQILTDFQADADYIVTYNPARFTSAIFEDSKPAQYLRSLNSSELHIPRITGTTLDVLESASKRAKKPLTFREGEGELEIGSQFELEHWRNVLFAQFEDLAEWLLPSTELILKKVERPKARTVHPVENPYDL